MAPFSVSNVDARAAADSRGANESPRRVLGVHARGSNDMKAAVESLAVDALRVGHHHAHVARNAVAAGEQSQVVELGSTVADLFFVHMKFTSKDIMIDGEGRGDKKAVRETAKS